MRLSASAVFVVIAAGALLLAAACTGDDDNGGPDAPFTTVEELARIVSVDLRVAESLPPQYFVGIVSEQSNGCTRFSRHEVRRDRTEIHIDVWNTVPKDPATLCTLVYSTTETNVALGIDFESGVTYTLRVNDQQQTFVAQ